MLWSRTDIRVRRARISDTPTLATVHSRAWLGAYRGIIPFRQLKSLIERRTEAWWRGAIRSRDVVLVLEFSGEVVGYATCGPSRTNRRFEGEIYELYVDPDHQGIGFGEYLFEGCRGILDQNCNRGLIVWVLSENESATRFYYARGGRPIAEVHERIGGVSIAKRAFTWD